MEYNYVHDRQGNRSNQANSQGQSQIQPPLHFEHQQYPPRAHHAMPTGYHGTRFSQDINSLQAPSSVACTAPGPAQSLVGLLPPRVPIGSGSARITNSESPGQTGHDYDHVLTAAMQEIQQVPTSLSSTEATQPQQQPTTLNSLQGPNYLIEDLSNSTNNNVAATPSTVRATPSLHNPASSNIDADSLTAVTVKKKGPCAKAKKGSLPQPVAQCQHEKVQTVMKYCQTESLFDETWRAEGMRAEPSGLPSGLAFIRTSECKIKGVISTKDLLEGKKFGPYTGEFVKEVIGGCNPSTWEVCVRGRTWFYLDGSTDLDNWMHHVQYARNTQEQNMEAFQSYGDIFFRITKPIKSGTELRVFYSPEYRKRVGFKTSLDELHMDQDNQMFQCQDCKYRYTNAKSLSRHLKFEHDKENFRSQVDSRVSIQSQPSTTSRIEIIASGLKKQATTAKVAAEKLIAKDNKNKQFLQVKLQPLITGNKDTTGANQDNARAETDMKPFRCKRCRKLFPSEGLLRQHLAFHREMKKIKPICKVCGLECKHETALKQHLLSHDSSSFQCPKCQRFLKAKKDFVRHLRRKHNMVVRTETTAKMEDKKARYVGPEKETEEQAEAFHPELSKDMLGKRILLTTKKAKVFKCKYCPQKFTSFTQVNRHELTVHKNSGQFKCEFCSQTFTHKDRFMVHRRKHTLDRPFKCEECPRSFSSESALKNHLPEHRGERPHKCDVCGKGFRTRLNMTNHRRRMHVPPTVVLKCSFCDKTFKDKAGLSRHEQRHKGIRPHVCLTCGSAFGAKYTLQSHMRIHTGEKPFECPVCKKKFSQRHHLSTHMVCHDDKGSTGNPGKEKG
nr:zinc finger protein 729-like [Lytechinus pictus]